jgi:hypothetical protein
MPRPEVKGAEIGMMRYSGSKFVTDRKRKVHVERRGEAGAFLIVTNA